MSWVKNLLQIFNKDDEQEFTAEELHTDKQLNPPTQRSYESNKEVDVRITYQYPKMAGPYSNRLMETRKHPMKPNQPEKSELQRPNTRHSKREKVQPYKKEAAGNYKGKPRRVHGPFHPTEIPSPVFGYHHRPKHSNPLIEYELSHFSKGVAEPLEAVEKEEVNIDSLLSVQKPPIPDVLETEGNSRDSVVESEKNVNHPLPETPVTLEKTGAADVQLEKVKVMEQPEKAVVGEQLEKAAAEEQPEKSEIGEQPEKGDAGEQFLPESDAQPKPERSKRSHLPFNVMMLKQDKRSLEERKHIRREEQVPSPKLEVVQPKVSDAAADKLPAAKEVQLQNPEKNDGSYQYPSADLLTPPVFVTNDSEWVQSQKELLDETLQNFNVGAHVVNVTQGPAVTRFEVQPDPGVKVNKVTNLSDDIKLTLAARDIRMEAPIPGKHTIGIEVPNRKSRPVFIKEIIDSPAFRESSSPLTAVLGLDIAGKPIVTDLKKMPHGLIAGATGSGKSVCINSILVSLLYKASPQDLKLLLIDPKMVELAPYNHIPHLVSPVITDVKAATAALKWAVEEMERRYELFAHAGVRDINRFNELAMSHHQYSDKLPYIVIVIDELADLMMMSPADVEESICRIAQKARACGIHLLIATQRPSVDVITGLIKANIPTRIAFSVSSQVDSRTIIDMSGAEKLLGRGDMLFLENGSSKPVRIQGTYVSDEEIDTVAAHVREQQEPEYLFQQEELLKKSQAVEEEDEFFYDACEYIIDQGGASTSSLQRRFKIGYNRAARLMDMLEDHGFITGANGSKPREVLITEADLESMQESAVN